ncbi:UNVERIFIED_CONTAM: tRNA-dihydrouridine(47) synthase [NAD(P)(+)]-like protein [Siphonaria sp. JEL0065]|nr:tRNA-dihydrouridine(47) synthase [NAD(P)(+)]-like protein [Siphonaria sp. JEL0065]
MADHHQRNIALVKTQFLFADPKQCDYRTQHPFDPSFLAAQELVAAFKSDPEIVPKDEVDVEKDDDFVEKKGKRSKKEKGKGQNKKRKEFNKTGDDSVAFCAAFSQGACAYENCKYSHDVDKYLESKGDDIGDVCVLFREYGQCRFGVRCRYAMHHSVVGEDGIRRFNVVDEAKVQAVGTSKDNLNKVIKRDLDTYKRTPSNVNGGARDVKAWMEQAKQYNNYRAQFATEAARVMKDALSIDESASTSLDSTTTATTSTTTEKKQTDTSSTTTTNAIEEPDEDFFTAQLNKALSYVSPEKSAEFHERTRQSSNFDKEFLSRCRDNDKKPFEWKGTYLAPLTNVGNLPFRRVAKDFGVDITCAEMMLANNLTNFSASEWALVRRHPSEKKFGLQISANNGLGAAKAGEVLSTVLFENPGNRHPELAPFDFIDINCGCPIDLVFKAGAGSALMGRRNRLKDIIYGLRRTLPVPISVKLRTGIHDSTNTAHKLIPLVAEWGASAVTLHGRSRQQRYTKTADWEYINECGKIAKESGIPFYGNGDVFGFDDYYQSMPVSEGREGTVDGVMVGRGALIKPWIFEEINEKKIWDISGRERFDIFKKFAEYGLEHWGSDTKGVNLTRTYMLDWMSFTYRYIPVGLLETGLPQKLNDRPPAYFGRDYYETLLGSWKVSDWIHVTELILGKAPADFCFVPKHKSNSYADEDGAVDETIHG